MMRHLCRFSLAAIASMILGANGVAWAADATVNFFYGNSQCAFSYAEKTDTTFVQSHNIQSGTIANSATSLGDEGNHCSIKFTSPVGNTHIERTTGIENESDISAGIWLNVDEPPAFGVQAAQHQQLMSFVEQTACTTNSDCRTGTTCWEVSEDPCDPGDSNCYCLSEGCILAFKEQTGVVNKYVLETYYGNSRWTTSPDNKQDGICTASTYDGTACDIECTTNADCNDAESVGFDSTLCSGGICNDATCDLNNPDNPDCECPNTHEGESACEPRRLGQITLDEDKWYAVVMRQKNEGAQVTCSLFAGDIGQVRRRFSRTNLVETCTTGVATTCATNADCLRCSEDDSICTSNADCSGTCGQTTCTSDKVVPIDSIRWGQSYDNASTAPIYYMDNFVIWTDGDPLSDMNYRIASAYPDTEIRDDWGTVNCTGDVANCLDDGGDGALTPAHTADENDRVVTGSASGHDGETDIVSMHPDPDGTGPFGDLSTHFGFFDCLEAASDLCDVNEDQDGDANLTCYCELSKGVCTTNADCTLDFAKNTPATVYLNTRDQADGSSEKGYYIGVADVGRTNCSTNADCHVTAACSVDADCGEGHTCSGGDCSWAWCLNTECYYRSPFISIDAHNLNSGLYVDDGFHLMRHDPLVGTGWTAAELDGMQVAYEYERNRVSDCSANCVVRIAALAADVLQSFPVVTVPGVIPDTQSDGYVTVTLAGDSRWTRLAFQNAMTAALQPDNMFNCAQGGSTVGDVESVFDNILDNVRTQSTNKCLGIIAGSTPRDADVTFVNIDVNSFHGFAVADLDAVWACTQNSDCGSCSTNADCADGTCDGGACGECRQNFGAPGLTCTNTQSGYCDDNGGADEGKQCYCPQSSYWDRATGGFYCRTGDSGADSNFPNDTCFSSDDCDCDNNADCGGTNTCAVNKCTHEQGILTSDDECSITYATPRTQCVPGCPNAAGCPNGLCIANNSVAAIQRAFQDMRATAVGHAANTKLVWVISAPADYTTTTGCWTYINDDLRQMQAWIKAWATANDDSYIDLWKSHLMRGNDATFGSCYDGVDPIHKTEDCQREEADILIDFLEAEADSDGVCTAGVCTAGFTRMTACTTDADCNTYNRFFSDAMAPPDWTSGAAGCMYFEGNGLSVEGCADDMTNSGATFLGTYATEGALAADFQDGQSDDLTITQACTDDLFGNDPATDNLFVSLTYRQRSLPTSNAALIVRAIGASGPDSNGMSIASLAANAYCRFYEGSGGALNSVFSSSALSNNTQYAIGCEHDAAGDDLYMYVDNAATSVLNKPWAPTSGTSANIGSTNSTLEVDGTVDELCVYRGPDRLSAAERCRIFSCGWNGDRCACDRATPANYLACTTNADCTYPGDTSTKRECEDHGGGDLRCTGTSKTFGGACQASLPACNAAAP